MKMMRIGLKYCGNCNPHIDGPGFVEALKKEMPDAVFCQAGTQDIDALLIVSGCPADCATRPVYAGPTVVVAGNTVGYIPYERDELLKIVKTKLRIGAANWTSN